MSKPLEELTDEEIIEKLKLPVPDTRALQKELIEHTDYETSSLVPKEVKKIIHTLSIPMFDCNDTSAQEMWRYVGLVGRGALNITTEKSWEKIEKALKNHNVPIRWNSCFYGACEYVTNQNIAGCCPQSRIFLILDNWHLEEINDPPWREKRVNSQQFITYNTELFIIPCTIKTTITSKRVYEEANERKMRKEFSKIEDIFADNIICCREHSENVEKWLETRYSSKYHGLQEKLKIKIKAEKPVKVYDPSWIEV